MIVKIRQRRKSKYFSSIFKAKKKLPRFPKVKYMALTYSTYPNQPHTRHIHT